MTMSIGGTTGLTFPDSSTQATAASGFGFKNRIINGAMVIDQRHAGTSVTPTGGGATYTLDRWFANITQASKFSVQQNAGSVTPPVGFVNYLGVTSLSAYTPVSSDLFLIQHHIEGLNVADLGWGTANAKTVTISFWVYSSLTGTFGGSVFNNNGSRSYPFSYSIPVANTWTQISVTLSGDTSGTWLTNNSSGLALAFSLGSGSTNSGTAGVWANTLYTSVTGATNVVGTSGATFYITGVQLEKGSTATDFDYRPYGTELVLCQRYYEKSSDYAILPYTASGDFSGAWVSVNINSGDFYDYGRCTYQVTKRTNPTIQPWSPYTGNGSIACLSIGADSGNTGVAINGIHGCRFFCNNSAMYGPNAAQGTHWAADAEIA